jgi:hypothetical protein
MEIGVRFEVIYDDIHLIEVRVSVWSGTFAGATDVYVGTGQLAEAAVKLQHFPRDFSDTREIMFGDFIPNSGGVSLRFYCIDRAGHAFVDSKVESDHRRTGKRQTATLSLPIEAAAVDSFVEELRRLETHKAGTAFLKGRA